MNKWVNYCSLHFKEKVSWPVVYVFNLRGPLTVGFMAVKTARIDLGLTDLWNLPLGPHGIYDCRSFRWWYGFVLDRADVSKWHSEALRLHINPKNSKLPEAGPRAICTIWKAKIFNPQNLEAKMWKSTGSRLDGNQECLVSFWSAPLNVVLLGSAVKFTLHLSFTVQQQCFGLIPIFFDRLRVSAGLLGKHVFLIITLLQLVF